MTVDEFRETSVISAADNWVNMAIKRIGILVGGGPAPGTNGVIAAVAIEAIKLGCAPIGFHDGFEWLAERYTDEQHEMTINEVSRLHLDGGVVLGTSRTDIAGDRRSLENAVAALNKLGIDALIAIGGDDLVRSAVAIEQETRGAIKVVLSRRALITICGCRFLSRRSATRPPVTWALT